MTEPRIRPVPGPAPSWRFPTLERHTLTNGLQVLACHLPDRGVIDVRLVLDGGVRREPPTLAGIATVACSALLEGSELRPAEEFNEALELLGAHLSVRPQWNGIVAGVTMPRSQLLPAIELLSELVATPGFREDDIVRATRRRIDETTIEDLVPQAAAANAFAAAVFPDGARMALPQGGNRAGLANVDPATVAAWWAEHAHPSTATLIVVGDLRGIDLATLAAKSFESWVTTAPTAAPFPAEAYPSPRRGLVVDFPNGVQTNLVIGQTFAPVADDDRPAMQVANHVLGGYFASRLVTILREEKGITYGVGSSIANRGAVSILQIQTAVEAGATEEAIVETVAQVASMGEGLTEVEVASAVDNLVGRGPIAFKTTGAVASQLESFVLHDLPDDYVDTLRSRMAEITTAEVVDAFRRYVDPANLSVAAAGPAARIGDLGGRIP